MNIPVLHDWELTPTEAVVLQRKLAGQVDVRRPLSSCELIAGADVSYNRFSPTFYAAVVVLRAADMSIVETQEAVGESPFPYVPGLLSFREAPILLEAFAKLQHQPDAVMIDGQGFAHPRRMGIACHLGLWLGIPTIGCAKTRLIGDHKEPGNKPGAAARLHAPPCVSEARSAVSRTESRAKTRIKKDVIGYVVRTKTGTKPLYLSAGHLIDLPSAVKLVLSCCRGYRLPEPTRQAHLQVNEVRRKALG